MPRRERKPPVRDTRTPRQKCLDYVLRHPGSTAEDVASGTRLRMTQVTPRLSDLVVDGVLVRDGKGRNRAGNLVHRYTPAPVRDLMARMNEDELRAHRHNRPRCPTCGKIVRQSHALEAGDAVREA